MINMLDFLKKESSKTYTENGAITYNTSNSNCLDLFSMIGGLRNQLDERIIDLFEKAYIEDKDIATKILFYTRDIRGGLGERRVFRVIVKWLADNYPDTIRKNIMHFNEFGRYDDLFSLFDTKCENDMYEYIKTQFINDVKSLLDKDHNSISLLAKWMPSINAPNDITKKYARKFARYLNLSDKEYRQTLTELRKQIDIIENYLRKKDYSFDYSKQPSNAMIKYKNAFIRNDKKRYSQFLELVEQGKKTLHTSTLYPYNVVDDIINNYFYKNTISDDIIKSWDTTWNQLEDFSNNENDLVVVDGSGSMYDVSGSSKPISVAISLAIYFSERNKGIFNNHFITFSSNPQLVKIEGENIYEKVKYCLKYNEVANTNIENVFKLILNTAKNNNIPQEELPRTIYVISDMEFDIATEDSSLTNFENAKKLFNDAGYKLPKLIFWNIQSRNNQVPVKQNELGVGLVSGYSPKLFSMIMENDNIDPYQFMMSILNNERYSKIDA